MRLLCRLELLFTRVEFVLHLSGGLFQSSVFLFSTFAPRELLGSHTVHVAFLFDFRVGGLSTSSLVSCLVSCLLLYASFQFYL